MTWRSTSRAQHLPHISSLSCCQEGTCVQLTCPSAIPIVIETAKAPLASVLPAFPTRSPITEYMRGTPPPMAIPVMARVSKSYGAEHFRGDVQVSNLTQNNATTSTVNHWNGSHSVGGKSYSVNVHARTYERYVCSLSESRAVRWTRTGHEQCAVFCAKTNSKRGSLGHATLNVRDSHIRDDWRAQGAGTRAAGVIDCMTRAAAVCGTADYAVSPFRFTEFPRLSLSCLIRTCL